MIASVLTVLAFAAGLAAIAVGVALVYLPAGVITAGAISSGLAVLYTRGER